MSTGAFVGDFDVGIIIRISVRKLLMPIRLGNYFCSASSISLWTLLLFIIIPINFIHNMCIEKKVRKKLIKL